MKSNFNQSTINSQTKYFFYYVSTNVLKTVGKKAFMSSDAPVCVADWGKIRLVGVISKRKQVEKMLRTTYQPESFVKMATDIFNDVSLLIKVIKSLRNVTETIHSVNSRKILHIIKFLLQAVQIIQQGASIPSLITMLIDFYLVINENTWKAEMLEQVCMASLSMLLPTSLFEIIKRLQYFSTSKLSDDVSGFHRLISVIIEALRWMYAKAKEYIPLNAKVETMCEQFFSFCENNSLHIILSDIKSALLEVKKSSRSLVSLEFREKVKTLQSKVKDSTMPDWCRKSSVVHSIIQDFERLFKRVLAFENCSRVEPICFVLEGPPGCGKSVALNYVVDLLGKTKYVHTVKDVSDGKDFYDSYNDEEVFYMDDVGQQGVSQWRSFINMVSEVKYPLDCANADLKDTKFFNSEIILATTNNFMNLGGLTKQDGISNIEALWRRAYVFDFSQCYFSEGEYYGTIYLRSHQTETSFSDGGFVNNVQKHVRGAMPQLHPDSNFNYRKIVLEQHDPNNKFKLGLWIASIVTMLHKKQVLNKELNTTKKADKDEVQKHLQNILNWKPESDIEFTVGPLGFRVSYYIFLLKQILADSVSVLWDSITAFDWGGLLMYIIIFTVITSLFSFTCDYFKAKPVGFKPEGDLQNLISLAGKINYPTTQGKIMKNLKYLSFLRDDGTAATSIGLVSGHHVLVTSHTIGNSKVVSIFQDSSFSHAVYDKLKFEVVYTNLLEDLAIIRLPHNLATVFPNISHFFKKAHDGAHSLNLVLPSGVLGIGTPLSGCVEPNGAFYTTNLRAEWNGFKHAIMPSDCFYNFRASGLCGSVLMDNEQVVGFHIAGDSSRNIGVSKIFSANTISDIFRVLERDKSFYIGNMSEKILENSSVLKLEQKSNVHVGTNSNLVPTEIYGIFPVSREPADLQVFGKNTVKDIAKKSFGHTTYVKEKYLNFGKAWLKEELSSLKPFILPEEQIVKGNDILAGLNKKSSNGFGNSKKKEDYIDFERGNFTPKLRDELQQIEGSIKEGAPLWNYFYWVEALKDELRNVEKEKIPRSFRVGTIQHQVLMKKYFGCLVEHIMNRRDINYIMVGCNPLVEWPKMHKKLMSCRGIFAGDIAKWDGSMNNMVQDAIKEVLCGVFGNDPVADFLLEQAIRSIVLVSDDCYITTHSMPSGHYLTAILNSIVNRFYSAMWYAMMCDQSGENPKVHVFNENIIDYVYGDDKLVGIKKLDIDYFNAISMRDFFTSMNMGFTDASKNPVVKPFNTFDEVTFLKRSFTYHFELGRIACPLELRTLQNSLSYFDLSKDYEVVLEAKIDNYLREIYLHPDYLDLQFEFISRLRSFGINKEPFSNEYLCDVYNRAFLNGFDPSLFYWGQVDV